MDKSMYQSGTHLVNDFRGLFVTMSGSCRLNLISDEGQFVSMSILRSNITTFVVKRILDTFTTQGHIHKNSMFGVVYGQVEPLVL